MEEKLSDSVIDVVMPYVSAYGFKVVICIAGTYTILRILGKSRPHGSICASIPVLIGIAAELISPADHIRYWRDVVTGALVGAFASTLWDMVFKHIVAKWQKDKK